MSSIGIHAMLNQDRLFVLSMSGFRRLTNFSSDSKECQSPSIFSNSFIRHKCIAPSYCHNSVEIWVVLRFKILYGHLRLFLLRGWHYIVSLGLSLGRTLSESIWLSWNWRSLISINDNICCSWSRWINGLNNFLQSINYWIRINYLTNRSSWFDCLLWYDFRS